MPHRVSLPLRSALVATAFAALHAGPAAALSITVNFTSGTAEQEAAFTAAANFWSTVIGNRFYQNSAERFSPTLTIDASVEPIDVPGKILAEATATSGVFYTSASGNYLFATAGYMTFDSYDFDSMSYNRLLATALHEMAHVIGLGTLWNYSPDGTTIFNDVYVDGTGEYYGEAALAAYQAEFDADATFVPVELGGEEGTYDAHWDEEWAAGVYELMTGWLNTPVDVSYVTLAQFADLGYQIADEATFETALSELGISRTVALTAFADVPLPGGAPLALLGIAALGLVGRRRSDA